uniref:HAT C-terminal dimerisation domain-containing protein n=1 Tax=Gopherus agassizii TaxID=38772 RepID=A0A452HN90_9SAUR
MSGEISSLQTRIREIAPNALFMHCCAHDFNLILIDALSSNIQTRLFFGTLESLFTFFSGSLPRLSILKEEQCNLIESFIFENDMKNIRSEFESEFKQIENEATELARKCDITTDYKQHRIRKRKRFHEEIAEDEEGLFDAREKFIVETYLVSLDSVINSTSKRFEHFKVVAAKFSGLDPKHFDNADNVNKLEFLADRYSDVIDSQTAIVEEFLSFKDMYKDIMITSGRVKSGVDENLTINSVLKFMIANDMCSIYPNLSRLYHIFLTLPISSAVVERPFSRLKLIKSYLHSTMSEDRLSRLALLAIERQLATEVDYNKVIDNFARMKLRRKRLL